MLGNRGNSLWSLGSPRCRVFHSKEQKLIEFPPRTGLIDPAHDSSGTLSGGVGGTTLRRGISISFRSVLRERSLGRSAHHGVTRLLSDCTEERTQNILVGNSPQGCEELTVPAFLTFGFYFAPGCF